MRNIILVAALFVLGSCSAQKEKALKPGKFPYIFPNTKPAIKLSEAMNRNYDLYPAPRPEDNELYSQFKYTEIKGLDYNGGVGV